MNDKRLDYIELNSTDNAPEYLVIWLHGLGADGNDFVPVIPQLQLKKNVKFIFPNAPIRPITVNNGYKMRGWYDIYDFGAIDNTVVEHKVDIAGITDSVKRISELIEEQMSLGFSADKIAIVGFSQGGVISYCTGLNYKHSIAGIISLSSYFPGPELLDRQMAEANKTVPILICHGTADAVIPCHVGMQSYEYLRESGYNVTWKEYPMQHSVCAAQLLDISQWMDSIFK